jgi:DNA-directed RNA polymerase specialized sigma24 family protein
MTTKHKIQAVTPRLSDEDPDPLEQDDVEGTSTQLVEGWLPWEPDDIADIRNLIENNMPPKQREVLLAFLNGQSYNEIHVTEKYWRYHFSKGIEFIKKELGL